MFITDIKKDKKHLSRIFLSNGEEILIDVDLCIEKGLSSGYETDEEFLKKLREESERYGILIEWIILKMPFIRNLQKQVSIKRLVLKLLLGAWSLVWLMTADMPKDMPLDAMKVISPKEKQCRKCI